MILNKKVMMKGMKLMSGDADVKDDDVIDVGVDVDDHDHPPSKADSIHPSFATAVPRACNPTGLHCIIATLEGCKLFDRSPTGLHKWFATPNGCGEQLQPNKVARYSLEGPSTDERARRDGKRQLPTQFRKSG